MESTQKLTFNKYPFLKELGLQEVNHGCYKNGQWVANGQEVICVNPHDNKPIAKVRQGSPQDYEECVKAMESEKVRWMKTPAPIRGEIIRQVGEEMRKKKQALGDLISLEMGKVRTEGAGEVQEFIDICEMATGMSRTIDGKVLNSERPGHFMMEVWNPLGIIGCITAFNFPVAVVGWNAAIALICGNMLVWKGSETTNLTTIATTKMVTDVL